jgi:hypothetical protein
MITHGKTVLGSACINAETTKSFVQGVVASTKNELLVDYIPRSRQVSSMEMYKSSAAV